MTVKRPIRRLSVILGVWGLLLSGILLLGSGTARALPDPQALEDATLVAIVRPDPQVPNGYRIEEIISAQDGNKVGDLLLLPDLRLDRPSEDADELGSPDEDDASEPQQGMDEEDDAAPTPVPAKRVAAPRAQPTYASPPPNAFPEAPIPDPPKFKAPKKNKKTGKNMPAQSKPTPVPTSQAPTTEVPPTAPPANSSQTPLPPPNAFPEAPTVQFPPNAFPEAPVGSGVGQPVLPPFGVTGEPTLPPVTPTPSPTLAPIPLPSPTPSFPTAMGNANGSGVVPNDVNPETRILVYLWYSPNGLSRYSVTGEGHAYAWVKEASHVEILREEARTAQNARRDWKLAVLKTKPQEKLAALWPFLSSYEMRYNPLVQLQFVEMGAPAGDYLAARWGQTDSKTRMTLLPTLSSYHSAALHRRLIAHLKAKQKAYEVYLAGLDVPNRERADNWNALPEKMKGVYGEIYYGLVGLAGFKDRSDLPYIRELARWALKYRFKQTNDAALSAFKAMPAEGNLTLITDIWREYSTRPIPGNELSPHEVIATLQTHRFPATVPMLAVFLRNDDPNVVKEARSAMRSIVGRDLGQDPMAWVKWTRAQEEKPTKAPVKNLKPIASRAAEGGIKTATKARALTTVSDKVTLQKRKP